jgi:DnaJ-class molecular chaperone
MKLEEWEVECNGCKGLGCLGYSENKKYKLVCAKCNGEGKLDFIENIVGKKNEWDFFAGDFTLDFWVPIKINGDKSET